MTRTDIQVPVQRRQTLQRDADRETQQTREDDERLGHLAHLVHQINPDESASYEASILDAAVQVVLLQSPTELPSEVQEDHVRVAVGREDVGDRNYHGDHEHRSRVVFPFLERRLEHVPHVNRRENVVAHLEEARVQREPAGQIVFVW